MALWILQLSLDLVMAAVAVMWLLSRKKILLLENELEALRQNGRAQLGSSQNPIDEAAQKTGNVAPSEPAFAGQLIERKYQSEKIDRAPIDAYEKADMLISKGLNLKEVSRQTGLSLAEIQLMGKVSSRTQ